jgi:hypothetical protein
MTNKTVRVLVLYPDGTAQFRSIATGLESFQALVGGYIEIFDLPEPWNDLIGVCNEEGTIMGLQPNPFSWAILGPPSANRGMPVSGVVVVLRSTGEFTALTDADVASLTSTLNSLGARVVV